MWHDYCALQPQRKFTTVAASGLRRVAKEATEHEDLRRSSFAVAGVKLASVGRAFAKASLPMPQVFLSIMPEI